MLADLAGGLSYLKQRPTLRTLVLLALLPMVLGMPYMTMLTVFASDVLKVGAAAWGCSLPALALAPSPAHCA
jgi:hypothetical protein